MDSGHGYHGIGWFETGLIGLGWYPNGPLPVLAMVHSGPYGLGGPKGVPKGSQMGYTLLQNHA